MVWLSPWDWEKKATISAFTIPTQHNTGISKHCHKSRICQKKKKKIQIGKKERKLSLLADNMLVYVVNSKECIKTSWINKWVQKDGRIPSYYANVFLYADDIQVETKIKDTT